MTGQRSWTAVGSGRWACPPWSIVEYSVSGRPMFALWRGEEKKAAAYDPSRDVLMRKARELEGAA